MAVLRRRTLLLVAGVLAVSWGGPLVRLATEAPPLAIAFWRTAVASAILIPLAVARRGAEIRALERRDYLTLAASGTFLAVHFATWIASIDLTTVASSVLLVTSVPIWAALVSGLMGGALSHRAWLGIALAIAGAALISGSGFAGTGTAGLGNLLALTGALAGAGYLLMGRQLRPRLSLLTYAAAVYGVCALLLLAALLAGGTAPFGYRGATWLAILGLAFGPQLIGHTTFNFLLKDLEAWKVAVAMMGEPIGSTVIAAFLFRELPGPIVVPGGVLLLGGIGLAVGAEGRLREVA